MKTKIEQQYPCQGPFRGVLLFLFALFVQGLFAQAVANPPQEASLEVPAPPEPASPQGDAWIITIRGDIAPSMVTFVRRETKRALDQGAAFLIFEIDTLGGRVDSALQISSVIMSVKEARTVAWVSASSKSMGISWSAGALIALSCSSIYMAPGTSVGAAAPVTVVSGGEPQGAGEKSVAAVRSQMAALAERNGYPVGIALAMVDYDVELWEVTVNGSPRALTLTELLRLEREGVKLTRVAVISPPGKLLSLTSGDALRYGLLSGIADTREALLESLGARTVLEESEPGMIDGILSLLSAAPVQAILIILGLVLIFLEINTPGFGIPGLIAILCFAAVFGAGALQGQVGSLELILFLAGLGLLAAEIFIIPGFGIVGISGFVCIGLSLILSMQDFIIPHSDLEWDVLGRNALVVCVGIIAAVTGIALIALLGPRIRIFDSLTLHTRITGTAGGPVQDDEPPPAVETKRSRRFLQRRLKPESSLRNLQQSSPRGLAEPDGTASGTATDMAGGTASGHAPEAEQGYGSLTGKTGRAASTLRPSGKAEIDGRQYAVEAEGVYIESGDPIRVIRVLGNRVVVEKSNPAQLVT